LFRVEERGRAVNFIMSFGVVGGGVAPKVLDQAPWWVLTLPMAVACIAALGLRETKRVGVGNKEERQSLIEDSKVY
jgi:hypothetical protein